MTETPEDPTMVEEARYCARCGVRLDATPMDGMCPGCLLRAGMSAPFPEADLRRLFPELEVRELVGRGGMGSVYRARQVRLERDVALKLLPPGLADQPGFAERFTREARALARLSHPNIVTVFDFGHVEGHYYLVMEYISGVNLRQLLQQRMLDPKEALALVPQICDALQYAHDRGVVHRDVKPENILLDDQGRLKIADFGLAKLTDPDAAGTTLTAPHQIMGTPRYMAPEQIERSHHVDHRADIYSLGIVFYEMLTGELPLGRFEVPSKKVEVDVRLDDVVLKALEKAPERRYQQAAEVKTAVQQLDAAPEEEESGAENFIWIILTFLIPPLSLLGVDWADSWWPLTVLFFPASILGSCFRPGSPTRDELIFVVSTFLWCLFWIGFAMQRLESADPLFAILVMLGGMAVGKEEARRQLGDGTSEDDPDAASQES